LLWKTVGKKHHIVRELYINYCEHLDEMTGNQLIRAIKVLTGIGLSIMIMTFGCSENRAPNVKSETLKPIDKSKILQGIVDRHLTKFNAIIASDLDTTSVIIELGLDSIARFESLKPKLLKRISDLKASKSPGVNSQVDQLSRIVNTKGFIYMLPAILESKKNKFQKIYFVIHELEQDTIISWTTKNSLTSYMETATFEKRLTAKGQIN
jgi:hypothetical protein